MKLLHVDSSIMGEASVSRMLTAALVEKWRARVPELEVTYRDLAAEPLTHLSSSLFATRAAEARDRTREQQQDLEASDTALAEFLASDVVVVGAPMYNFSVPNQLKAWIDRLAVAGKTFRYTSKGPEGLAGARRSSSCLLEAACTVAKDRSKSSTSRIAICARSSVSWVSPTSKSSGGGCKHGRRRQAEGARSRAPGHGDRRLPLSWRGELDRR